MTPPTETFHELPLSERRSRPHGNGGAYEPPPTPRPTVAHALLRYWYLVLIPTILLAGAGAALALKRPTKYTSEASLNVGKANPTSASFGGYVSAAAGLAAVYSRQVGAPGVIEPISRQLNWTPGVVGGRLSATPVQDSPIIRVIGTGPSAAAAKAVANAGARQLTRYVAASNRKNPDAARLYGEYQKVAAQKADSDLALAKNNRALNDDPGNSTLRAKIAEETATGNSLGLRLSALNGAYVAAEASQAQTSIVTPLSPATAASSDRSSKVQTLGGAGMLAGLVIGIALAMWRANRAMRRRAFG